MNYISLSSSALSILPALLLTLYVYSKDRVEKEPLGLLGLLFGAGVVAFVPVFFIKRFAITGLTKLFNSIRTVDVTGAMYFSGSSTETAYGLLYAFICVAFIEEIFIWLALFLITSKNKNFNCTFDGIVYAVFTELGFAVIENIRFAFADGFDMLLRHALISVPTHLFFGVIMGVCYTKWFIASKARRKRSGILAVLSFIVPTVIHGFYVYLSMLETPLFTTLYYVYIAVVYVSCFVAVNITSKKDSEIAMPGDNAGGDTNV